MSQDSNEEGWTVATGRRSKRHAKNAPPKPKPKKEDVVVTPAPPAAAPEAHKPAGGAQHALVTKARARVKDEYFFVKNRKRMARNASTDFDWRQPQAASAPGSKRNSPRGPRRGGLDESERIAIVSGPCGVMAKESLKRVPSPRKSPRSMHYKGTFMLGKEPLETKSNEEMISGSERTRSRVGNWTQQHYQILAIISHFSQYAEHANETERWIRQVPLLVLVYEGIVRRILDYDYAPVCIFLEDRYVNLNISQQGMCDIDDLIEGELVKGLKVSFKKNTSTTAYQISPEGRKMLKAYPGYNALIKQLQPLIRCCYDLSESKESEEMGEERRVVLQKLMKGFLELDHSEQLQVEWREEGREFVLHCRSPGHHCDPLVSTITECEDVSYVCSPYLPRCLLNNEKAHKKFVDNSSRKIESAAGISGVRDELEELITLSDVHVLMGEYIPFGANQIYSLNHKLGSTERTQGGLFLATLNDKPVVSTQFECRTGLTSVKIVDFDEDEFLAFQAEIKYPEDPGIVQVEHFGVSARDDGTVVYGMKVESILDRTERMSLDHLARVIMDMREDSSRMINNLLSDYQHTLLETMFLGSSINRSKMNVLVASSIEPKLSIDKYLDRGGLENEIRQVIGDVLEAFKIAPDDFLFVGTNGLLLAGPNARSPACERTLMHYTTLKSMKLFHQCFYRRAFALHDTLKQIRIAIAGHETDPNSVARIRQLHSRTENEAILMQEILSYLYESLSVLKKKIIADSSTANEDPASAVVLSGADVFMHDSDTEAGERLLVFLKLRSAFEAMQRRVADMAKNIESAKHELQCLQNGINNIEATRMFHLSAEVRDNTKSVEDVFKSNERASNSLEMLEVIMSGTLAFEILDRLTGEWSVVDQPWAKTWIVEPLIETPGLWFLVNILLWALIGYALIRFMRYLSDRAEQVMMVNLKLNLPIHPERMAEYLRSKNVSEESVDVTQKHAIKKARWEEEEGELWGPTPPEVQVVFDSKHGFLLQANLTVEKTSGVREDEETLRPKLIEDLRRHNVIRQYDWRSECKVAFLEGET